MVKSKSRSIYTMAKKGRNILEKVEKIPQKRGIISVGTVALGRNSSYRHCAARSKQWCVGVIYRLSILVSADVSQPIQKINGINYLMSADTNNLIFGIGYAMPTDTNNVSGIRGVTCDVKPKLTMKFSFAPSACTISRRLPLHHRLPRRRRRLPQHRCRRSHIVASAEPHCRQSLALLRWHRAPLPPKNRPEALAPSPAFLRRC
jgi:hypothetical protein